MLKWVFGADTGPFRRGLNQMRDDVKGFSGTVKGSIAGMFGVAALTAWGKAMIDQAGRIDDLAKRLDMSAESVQRIGYAAEQAGSDVEGVAKGLTILTKNLSDADAKTGPFADAMSELGLSIEEFRDLAPEDQLVALSKGYADAGDKGTALASIMKLMGKSGAELIPMLAEGPDALRQQLEDAVVASDTQIAKLAKMGDQMDRLKSMSLAAFATIITGFQTMGAYAEWALNMMFNGKEMANDRLFNDLNKIVNGDGSADEKKKNDDVIKKASELAKIMEDRQKLAEEIAKLEEDSRFRQLSLDEQILELKKKQAELAADSIFSDTDTALAARKEELEIAKQISDLQKTKDEESAKHGAEVAARNDEFLAALDAEAKMDRDNKFAAMSDEEKLTQLKKEQADLMKESYKLFKEGDATGGIEKRTQAKGMQGEINALMEGMNRREIPSVISDDLRKIGGGGNAVLAVQNPQAGVESRLDRAITILNAIDKNTNQGSKGSKSPFDL